MDFFLRPVPEPFEARLQFLPGNCSLLHANQGAGGRRDSGALLPIRMNRPDGEPAGWLPVLNSRVAWS